MRILLVEDDDMIGESVMAGLETEGHAIDWVRDGNSALLALNTTPYSLVILDLGLPGKDGLQVLKEMRGRRDPTPDLDELSARIRALLRRSAGRADPVIERGELKISPATREVTYKGEPVILSSKEYALLAALAERKGVVWSRAQLEEKLYNWDNTVGSNAIEVHIHHLRKKLADSAIKTVRGVGYMLET